MDSKKWYLSRTLWVNVIAIVVILVQIITDNELINVEAQASILAVINVILRLITSQPIETPTALKKK
jgi:hypothetical protein